MLFSRPEVNILDATANVVASGPKSIFYLETDHNAAGRNTVENFTARLACEGLSDVNTCINLHKYWIFFVLSDEKCMIQDFAPNLPEIFDKERVELEF